MGDDLVVLGGNGRPETTSLPAILTGRGRDVVSERWPPEQLVAFAVESGAGAVVLFGSLSSGALRSVSEAVECRPEFGAIVVGPLDPNVEVLVALASGFSGYLPAGSAPVTVADAVDVVLAGGIVLPRASATPLVEHLRSGGRGVSVSRFDGSAVELTGREWEVLLLLRQARSTAEIAARLCVSTVTVRTHVAVLVQKLLVADRAALMVPPMAEPVGKNQRGPLFRKGAPVDTFSAKGGDAAKRAMRPL